MKSLKRVFFTSIILNTFLVLNLLAQTGSSLTFSEVMFRPIETNGEFVEIYNTSTTEIIDLAGFKFKYYTSTNDNIVAFIGGTKLAPGKFAVILENDYDYNNGVYKKLIPPDVIVLKISDASFGTSGMANTTSRDIYLISSQNQTIDTYLYSADNSDGYTDEKIILDKNNNALNWKNSTKLNGTPGTKNSVSPLDYDLGITFTGIVPAEPKAEDSVKVTALVKNPGRTSASNFSVTMFNDANNDSIGQSNESIFSSSYSNLASGDSIIIQKTIYISSAGNYFLIAGINFTHDENTLNNKTFFKFTVIEKPAVQSEIVINEIMYAPSNDEPEWIELFSRANRPLNLKGWKVGDNSSLVTISTTDYFLDPGEYLIISNDAAISSFHQIPSKLLIRSLPSLSNNGDDVILKSNTGSTIDSLKYLPAWGGTGSKSLERIKADSSSIDQTNWKTSQSKLRATPGRINSVTPKSNDLSLKSFIPAVRYAELGKSFKAMATVENSGNNPARNFLVKVYNDQNLDSVEQPEELISELTGADLLAGNYITVEFTITNFNPGQNQFIAKIEFTGDEYLDNNNALFKINGVFINELKGDLVVNEIMYAPNPPEQEWIEIYNTSSKQINLKGYKIANRSDTTKVIGSSTVLLPEEYFVIAKDTLMFSKYSPVTKLFVAAFPSLSNSRDKVILLDSLNRAIDSLEYKNSWGGSAGKSLEKIEAASSSNDSTNWKSSAGINGATPGFVNSVSKKKFDVAVAKLIFIPFNPLAGQRVTLQTEVVNIGRSDASFKIVLNEINRSGSRIKVEESVPVVLPGGNSLLYDFNFVIESIQSKRNFEVVADYLIDEDQTNNKYVSSIRPGYPAQIVLINEVMYNPINGEPEWIELYNNSQFDVDLEDWSITDVLTAPLKTKIQSNDYTFAAKSFLVVAKDSTIKNFHKTIPSKLIVSTFANLNNDADGVVLKDSRDVTIDSVGYEKFYGGENGKSLERKSIAASSLERNNWGSSKDIELSTPGRINSISPKKYDLSITEISTSPQYPAYNEEVNLLAKVVNYGSERINEFFVKFYLHSGNTVIFFSDSKGINLPGNDSVWIVSNSKLKLNENKIIFCNVIFGEDEDTLNNSFTAEVRPGSKRNTVLISEVMYDPLPGESEWIEIVNAWEEPVNLKNWLISDELPSPTKSLITAKDNILNPGDFAVLTSDSIRFPYYPPKKFFQTKFGALGNTTDGVLIYDFRGAVIDSLKYNSGWGGGKGFSIERFSPAAATNDSLNWATTLNPDGGTPGIKNSIINMPEYSSGSLVINEIMYEPQAGSSEYLEFYNTTNDSIQLGGMEIKLSESSKIKLSISFLKLPPQNYFMLASDSSIYKNFPRLKDETKIKIVGSTSLGLSNEGQPVVLRDLRGNILDSLFYSPLWHNKNIFTTKNKSLERLNPLLNSNSRSNWSTSVSPEGGSPGIENSIFTQNLARQNKVTINPNPFSPDSDGFEDFAIINFDLTQPLSQVRIKVFDSQGRLVRTLAENRPSASNNSVIFDGLDDNNRPLRIGIYILLIEAAAQDSGSVDVIKVPIVIARRL
ncbi:MAG: lamin tail domain-containing protein [Bacteroidota bacterium]